MELRGFVYGSYEAHAFTADQERTVNLYAEEIQSPGGTARTALLKTPGVEEIAEHSSGPGRAHFFMDGREFAVLGTDFVEIAEDGTITDHGNVATDANPATISSNGDSGGELFITSGGNGYLFTLATDTFASIAALAGIATIGDQLDGYFIALDAATSKVYASELNDGATWNTGTSFAQRSGAPDPWIGLKVNGQYIWKFGQQTSEVWFDSASTPYPFSRAPAGTIQYGIAAGFSAAVADGTTIWLGATAKGNGFVVQASGFQAEVISTPALQLAINSYDTVSDAHADVINYLGHTFYRLHFPTADKTWAYDLQNRQWFEWMTWISEDNDYVAQRARWHAHAFGEHRMLDSETGSIYRLGPDLLSDVDEREIRWLRRAPAVMKENERVYYPGFEVLMDVGLGTVTGQGANPQVMMRYSNDGGRSWSPEQMRTAGEIGEYETRVRWTRCGQGRKRVWEVSGSDPAPTRLIGAVMTPEPYPAGRRRGA